jgi:hypothetical protein
MNWRNDAVLVTPLCGAVVAGIAGAPLLCLGCLLATLVALAAREHT